MAKCKIANILGMASCGAKRSEIWDSGRGGGCGSWGCTCICAIFPPPWSEVLKAHIFIFLTEGPTFHFSTIESVTNDHLSWETILWWPLALLWLGQSFKTRQVLPLSAVQMVQLYKYLQNACDSTYFHMYIFSFMSQKFTLAFGPIASLSWATSWGFFPFVGNPRFFNSSLICCTVRLSTDFSLRSSWLSKILCSWVSAMILFSSSPGTKSG